MRSPLPSRPRQRRAVFSLHGFRLMYGDATIITFAATIEMRVFALIVTAANGCVESTLASCAIPQVDRLAGMTESAGPKPSAVKQSCS